MLQHTSLNKFLIGKLKNVLMTYSTKIHTLFTDLYLILKRTRTKPFYTCRGKLFTLDLLKDYELQ